MIQIYDKTNTDYSKNGNVSLTPTSCILEAELNGSWILTLVHPIDEMGRWKSIVEDAVIQCDTFMPKPQRFRIFEKSKSGGGVIAYARPIFQDSKDTVILDVRPMDKTGQEALDLILDGTGFNGKSDIDDKKTVYLVRKNIPDALLGRDENSFVNRWGGEVVYDNETVVINKRAGGDYGVSCEFGKNLREIEEIVNLDNVITRIVPVSYQGYMLEGDSPWVDSPNIGKYATIHMREVQFKNIALAEDVEGGYEDLDALRVALREAASKMFLIDKVDEPSVNYVIDMVNLAETVEYKNYKILETVGLGDTIYCRHKKLNIEVSARVVRIVYDCIRKRNEEVELGNYQNDYFSQLQDLAGRIQQTITPSGTVRADTIQGIINSMNVQLRAQKSVAQKQEIRAMLFEDLDPDSPTYGAMSIGTMGLQISSERTSDGRDWNWTTAMTAKGAIADILVAGILSDKSGKNFWNLETGEFHLSAYSTTEETEETISKTIKEIRVEYATSGTSTESPTSGWSVDSPAWVDGQYIWQRVVYLLVDGTEEVSVATCITGATGTNGEDAVTLRIDSSRGTVFKNSEVSTVLSAVIYKGSVRITDAATLKRELGNNAYLQWSWQRMSEEAFGTIVSSDSRLGNDGFTLTLSPDDVDTKVVFMCQLITD